MNLYENIVILDANLADEAIETAVTRITDLIVAQGGEILKKDPWGRRKLAYELNKHKKGFMVLLLFKAPPPTIKALEELYKVFDPVVKFMVIKLEKKQTAAAMAALARAEAAAAAAAAPPPPPPPPPPAPEAAAPEGQ